jgi:hypothetical protein
MKSRSSNENKAKTQKIENGWMILSNIYKIYCVNTWQNHPTIFKFLYMNLSNHLDLKRDIRNWNNNNNNNYHYYFKESFFYLLEVSL